MSCIRDILHCPLARFLLLAVLPTFASQSVKNDDLGITVEDKARLFAKHVISLGALDLANAKAMILDQGRILETVNLKQGGGQKRYYFGDGSLRESTEVHLAWQRALDLDRGLAYYEWGWYTITSDQSGVVQVFELREGKAFIVQQINFNTHHGGPAVGATFDPKTNALIVRSVPFDSPAGRCCPSHINTVTFHWDGNRFVRVRARRALIPKQD